MDSSRTSRATLLFTSDLHGRAGAEDPLTGRPSTGGMGRIATLLEEARRRDPRAVYLDLGDLAQGTPMSYLHAVEHGTDLHPMVLMLNALGCRGMVIGNHDFNFGLRWVETLRRTAEFPILGANVIGPDGQPFFEPVLRLRIGGRRIAVLGLTTPQVPRWEEPWNYEGLVFRDAVETALEWLPRLREESDAVVVAAHMGWEGVSDGGLEDPAPHENAIRRLLERTDLPDVVLMAHTHREIQCRGDRGTLALQAGAGAQALGEAVLHWDDPADGTGPAATARPRVEGSLARAGFEIAVDPAIDRLARRAEERTRSRILDVVGEAADDFRPEGARYGDNPVASLIHRAQLWSSGAELSSSALFRREEGLARGPIRMLDLFRVYPYENGLTLMELTVDDIRDYLEQIALAYAGPGNDGDLPPLDPRISLYNHDTLAGCEYTIDPARPPGSRITDLTFDGDDRPGGARVTMALTSYRAQGGGGYRALRRGRVVERTGREIRTVLADYVRSQGTVHPRTFGNWRVLGADGSRVA